MPNLRRTFACLLLPMLLSLPRGAISDEADQPGVLALVGGRILTQADSGEIEGTILVRDGRIEAVGPDVEIPEGADRVDLSGLVVTPGLIDARGVLWLPPESRRDGGDDGSLDILDGVDPYAEDWLDVARSGVTAVAVQPGNSGLFGGRGAVLRVGPGGTVEDLTIRADAFVQAALGVNNASANSVLRYQQFEQLKRALDSVKKYKEDWEKYEQAKKKYDEAQAKEAKEAEETDGEADAKKGDGEEGEDDGKEDDPVEGDGEGEDDGVSEPGSTSRGSPLQDEEEEEDPEEDDEPSGDEAAAKKDEGGKAPSEPPKEPERDETKEFLVGLLDGTVPLRIEAHREDDLRNAFALVEEFEGLTLIVEGLSDPGSAREELVNRRTPMVLGPVLELGDTPVYRRDRARDWPAGLLAEDSRWAIGSYGERPADSALLRVHAAAVARGVPRDRVLRALTAGAAEVLGLEDELGSIAEGLRADLVAFAGDPIDPASPIALVVSGGEVVYRNPEVDPVAEESVAVVDAELPDRLPRRFVIRTRRLLGPGGSIAPGAVSVADGTIVAAGESVEEDDEIPAYDVGDAVVTPGLTSAFGTFGQGRAAAEVAGADAGFLRAVDAFDPTGRTVRELARGGVLRIGFAPAAVNVVAGAVGAVRLGPAADPVIDPVLGMDLVLSASARNEDRYPASLPGQVALLREFLGLEGGEDPSARRQPGYYLSDPAIERLDAVRRGRADRLRGGECVAFFEVDRPAEVEAALDLAEELEICPVLVGPGAIEDFPDRVARLAEGSGLALVLRPMGPGPEATRRMAAVVSAAEAGARVLFAADDAEPLRLLAASAVAAGLPRGSALDALAVGLNAIGPNDDADAPTGPWRPGAPADLVVWDGSPLDLSCRPLAVVVDGELLP
ncbi:amidohydrolase family protein [Tautonia plasticadhaerens]|nr:amidohydrolase family protein [Tautonia plasticadhaerens]